MKIVQKIIIISIITCLIIANCTIVFAESTYVYNKITENTKAAPVFNFQSESQILIEPVTGKVIYENKADEKLHPASVTKIMTMLLTMEAIDSGKIKLTDNVTCSALASQMGGSQIWFKENETLTVNDCLKAIAVASANDVAVAMAEHLEGSVENFAEKMNEKAKELNMKNTHFVNPHGIDDDDHYTTARDISLMSRELIVKHPKILQYTGIWMDSLRDGTFGLTNTNKLIRFYQGANGIKTGSTSQAMFNVSASATRNNMTLIAVIMKAPTSEIRNSEAKTLLDYGFSNYENITLSKKGTSLGIVKLEKANKKEIEIFQEDDINFLTQKGNKEEIKKEVKLLKNLKAPIKNGKILGEIIFKQEDKVILRKNIVNRQEICKITYLQMLKKIIKQQFMY